MARKNVQGAPLLESWEQVDDALKELLICQEQIEQLEQELNLQITAAKERLVADTKPLQEQIGRLEKQIRDYAGFHREELQGKSRRLNFGVIGFRQSSSVSVPTGRIPEIIAALREQHMDDCVSIKEAVNKDALRRYPLEKLQAVGCDIRQKESFWYEVRREELADPAPDRG